MKKGEENKGKEFFMSGKRNEDVGEEEGRDGGVEISLGLSLNGKFGVEPKRPKLVVNRSFSAGENSNANEFKFSLIRVPRETDEKEKEEEGRKKGEMESLRRLEAKRKIWEKFKNVRIVRRNIGNTSNAHEAPPPPAGNTSNAHEAPPPAGNNTLPSSGGSQGSGSSGVSDFETQKPIHAGPAGTSTDVNPLENGQPPVVLQQEQVAAALEIANERSTVILPAGRFVAAAKEMIRRLMTDMPCVSTRVGGPIEKKIEGFLYAYKPGEEVKIVCVCHGTFLTPAEFVKHAAGGVDIANPLRHIVINPSAFPKNH